MSYTMRVRNVVVFLMLLLGQTLIRAINAPYWSMYPLPDTLKNHGLTETEFDLIVKEPPPLNIHLGSYSNPPPSMCFISVKTYTADTASSRKVFTVGVSHIPNSLGDKGDIDILNNIRNAVTENISNTRTLILEIEENRLKSFRDMVQEYRAGKHNAKSDAIGRALENRDIDFDSLTSAINGTGFEVIEAINAAFYSNINIIPAEMESSGLKEKYQKFYGTSSDNASVAIDLYTNSMYKTFSDFKKYFQKLQTKHLGTVDIKKAEQFYRWIDEDINRVERLEYPDSNNITVINQVGLIRNVILLSEIKKSLLQGNVIVVYGSRHLEDIAPVLEYWVELLRSEQPQVSPLYINSGSA